MASKNLRQLRIERAIALGEFARRVGISRQALAAIEAGKYQPSVTVALKIARQLGETVETLFGLSEAGEGRHVAARWDAGAGSGRGAQPRVVLARVAGKVVAVAQPAARLALSAAAGTIYQAGRSRAEVATFHSPDEIDATLLIAGCDPAATLLVDFMARRGAGARAVALAASSRDALNALVEGRVHAAGVHLRDPRSGEYNLAAIRRILARRPAVVVNFARWECGFATAAGNPLGIRGFADLARPELRMINRERGSGARSLFDEGLQQAGISAEKITGYEVEAAGHLEVASAIAAGQGDLGVTLRVAAEAYGLDFVPLREERYDLVLLERERGSMPVRAMLDALNSRRFASEVGQMCGYDTSAMGTVIAERG